MPTLRRVRPRTAGGGEDRLSALSDDLIRLIVGRLDTRTALSTAALARRWAHIPRELPALDFRVSDILPPEYDRTVALRRRNSARDTVLAGILDGLMASCELRTLRAFADGITRFLEANGEPRRVKTLRLEFFESREGGCVDRLITAAVGAWGVDDLEIVVRPLACHHDAPAYVFPHDSLDAGARSLLRRLTLGQQCALPPLRRYTALTTLVLRDMDASTPVQVYQRVLTECPRLQALHLTSCRCADDLLVLDAPRSELRELVVDECSFTAIELRDLPTLARLACRLTDTAELAFGSVPRLTHTNLTFSEEDDTVLAAHFCDAFDQFLGTCPAMTNLVVRFTGLRRRIEPVPPERPLLNLKRILVADLPTNWNISWPRCLLTAAPSLEVLHIHVPSSEEEPEYRGFRWEAEPRHHPLKELLMLGFLQRHRWFLKYVVGVCTSLRRVVLRKDGHVRYNGLWDWEIVAQQSPWSKEDEVVVKRTIKSGPTVPLFELILG